MGIIEPGVIPRLTVASGDREAAHALVGKGADTLAEPNVRAPAIVETDAGEPIMAVLRHEGDLAELRRAMLAYPVNSVVRAAGIRNRSNVFGFSSRKVVMQRNSCRTCSGSNDAPEAHAALCSAGADLFDTFRAALPDVADAHMGITEAEVLPEWRIAGSPWTSGVLNFTSPLPYHYDRNNLEPVWSAMIVARRGVRGGHLHVPEHDLVVECRDGDVVYFPGWHFVHGVTPMAFSRDAYRMSAVFYAVRAMRDCLPWACRTERVRLLRMSGRGGKGGQLLRHTDITDRAAGVADGQVARFHVPLITDPRIVMHTWDLDGTRTATHLSPWRAWYLDARKPHAVVNPTGVDRIHLVIDVIADAAVREVIAA